MLYVCNLSPRVVGQNVVQQLLGSEREVSGEVEQRRAKVGWETGEGVRRDSWDFLSGFYCGSHPLRSWHLSEGRLNFYVTKKITKQFILCCGPEVFGQEILNCLRAWVSSIAQMMFSWLRAVFLWLRAVFMIESYVPSKVWSASLCTISRFVHAVLVYVSCCWNLSGLLILWM